VLARFARFNDSMTAKKKNLGGRPTDYRPEYCQKIIEYFSVKPYERDHNDNPIANDMPTKAGFAIELGVDRDTLKEWAKTYPEFSAAYKRCEEFQELFLVTNGMKGIVNPAFSMFVAKNLLKWSDRTEVKQDIDQKVKADIEVTVKEVDLSERVKSLKGES